MGLGDDARRCFTTKNKRVLGWARRILRFPLVKPYRKSTPGGRWYTPGKQSPRIMIYYAPIAKAIKQAKQARRRRSPCWRSAMRCPLCCFWRSALTEQGAKTIAYNQSKNESKQKRKQTSKDGKSKQAQARRLASSLAIITQVKQITPL